jgi:hypothetical protein
MIDEKPTKKEIELISFLSTIPGLFSMIIASLVLLAWGNYWWSGIIIGPFYIFAGAWAMVCGQGRQRELKKYGYLK